MAIFLDTSALVPVFNLDHVHHLPSIALFESLPTQPGIRAYCALHTLAEFYSATTRMPLPQRMAPDEALFHINQLLQRVIPVGLEEAGYLAGLNTASERQQSGGEVYDALILQAARKVQAETIYTWNVRHFQRLAPDLAGRIRTP